MMIRKLLATTALASVIATGAMAQSETTPSAAPSETPSTGAPAATETTPPAGAPTEASAGSTAYLQSIGPDQYLASDLTDEEVYASAAPDAAEAGEIDDFLVGNDGKVVAAIITTEGLEENKTVAVPFEKLTWSMDEENEPRAVLTATAEELAAAPEFTETTAADAAETGAAAPAAAPAATDNSAAAPAAPATAESGAEPMTSDAMGNSEYAATVGADQYLSQSIIGSGVYGGPGADAESVGSINDLVVNSDGQIAAAVVGVGGFLGIGEKNVGVPFAELQMMREDGTEPRIVMAATKDQLTAAPTFETESDGAASTAATSTGAATGTAGDTAASTAGTAADTTSTAANDAATATGNAAGQAEDTMANAGATTGAAATGAAAGAAATTGAAADATTTASTGGAAVDRASLTPVSGPELTAENLEGTTVYGPNDASIGEVGDIALNPEGNVDAVIVDVGGFLGIGQKPVAVAMDNLQFMKDSSGSMYLYTQFTQDQLENAPEYNSETYAQNRESMRLQSPGDAAAPAATAN